MRHMNIMEYFNNPAGVGAAIIPSREAIRTDYQNRFNKLFKEKKDLFRVDTFVDGKDYFILISIPSEEKDRNNSYDVVVKFNDVKTEQGSPTIRSYNIQLFSNSPSFIFTYAYVFNKEGLLVEELKRKLRDETFDPPTTRNPYRAISYEKSTFMAVNYILANPFLLEKNTFRNSKNLEALRSTVRDQDTVKIEISREKTRLKDLQEQANRTAKKDKEIADKRARHEASKSSQNTTGSNRRITPRKPKAKVTARKKSR